MPCKCMVSAHRVYSVMLLPGQGFSEDLTICVIRVGCLARGTSTGSSDLCCAFYESIQFWWCLLIFSSTWTIWKQGNNLFICHCRWEGMDPSLTGVCKAKLDSLGSWKLMGPESGWGRASPVGQSLVGPQCKKKSWLAGAAVHPLQTQCNRAAGTGKCHA